tara:strand:+ start:21617 stop:23227 length:1611 start_codon:yes stop_codon:yes gene_type:complete
MLLPLISSFADETVLVKIYDIVKSQKFFNLDYLVYDRKSLFKYFILIILFIYSIKFLINLFFNYYLIKQKTIYEKKITNTFLLDLLGSTKFDILNLPKSKILQDINGRITLVTQSIYDFSYLSAELIILTSLLLFFFITLGTNILIPICIFIFLSIIALNLLKKKAVNWGVEREKGGNAKNKSLLDILEGAREILVFGGFKSLIEEFKINNSKYLEPARKLTFWRTTPRIFLEFCLFSFILIYFSYIINQNLEFEKIIGSLAVIVVVLLRAVPSLNRIIFFYTQLKYASEAIQIIKKILQTSSLERDKTLDKEINFSKKISIEKIEFEYTPKFKIFENANLLISKDEKIAIIGETGLGKSTLVDIIAGLKRPSNGNVKIDNMNLSEEYTKSWIKKIAYVSQRVYLFNSSIRNNITFYSDDKKVDNKKLNEILKLVELDNFVKSKDEKELFSVGEFGSKVSGGQRQKIGIARALFSDRPIVIFDESTNSMDEATQKTILQNILAFKNKTIIFITHSRNLAQKFDCIYRLENKKIIKT